MTCTKHIRVSTLCFLADDVHVEHLDWWKFDITEGVEWIDFFNQSSAFMDNLYCKRPCKRDREALNSCCLKRLLSDKCRIHLKSLNLSFLFANLFDKF